MRLSPSRNQLIMATEQDEDLRDGVQRFLGARGGVGVRQHLKKTLSTMESKRKQRKVTEATRKSFNSQTTSPLAK